MTVADPLFRSCLAGFGLSPDHQAFIEMASVSGLPMLTKAERNPLYTSTYGTGELIAGLCQLAQEQKVPVIALCGALKASPQQIRQMGLHTAFSIAQQPILLGGALQKTGAWLHQTAFQIGRLL